MSKARRSRRCFTAAEDLLILAQSRGEMPFYKLEDKIRASREAIYRRANELKITPRIMPRSKNGHARRGYESKNLEEGESVVGDTGENPLRITYDLLLDRLRKEHPLRFYEELDLKVGRNSNVKL